MNKVKIRDCKNDKVLSFKAPRGGFTSLVREVYLKAQISCRTHFCKDEFCISEKDVRYISSDVPGLIFLDGSVALDYWELFELQMFQGIVITLSTLNYVQQVGGRRYYNRLKKGITDPAKSCVVFDNEYHSDCFQTQQAGEPAEDYTSRQNYAAACWYAKHIDQPGIEIVLISENKRITDILPPATVSPFRNIYNLSSFMEKYHSSHENALQLFESLKLSLNDSSTSTLDNTTKDLRENGYHPYELMIAGISSGSLIRGNIQVAKYNSSTEATVLISENQVKNVEQRSEILIVGQINRNRAVHGDTVCVELLPRSEWRVKTQRIVEDNGAEDQSTVADTSTESLRVLPTGRVVGIISRNWRDYVCCLEEQQAASVSSNRQGVVLVTPWDRRIPRIRVTCSTVQTLTNQRFLIRIDDWEVNSQYPRGHFVQCLGPVGDLETETQTLLYEHGLATRAFTAAQIAELPVNTPEHPWTVSPEEELARRDFRQSHLIFSIDPIGCTDVDDTLSIRRLDDNMVELGVHIADVTHFVKGNSLIDLEARVRSTSVYLADRRVDMLPNVLSSDLCSLWSDKDRYAVSVLWVLTPDLEVKDIWFGRSIIRSRYKLTYEIAQEIYEDKNSELELVEKIPELKSRQQAKQDVKPFISELQLAVKDLVHLASRIQERRLEGGGLELEGLEVQILFNDPDRKQMEDLLPKQPLQVHETIAECMIFANHYVAKRILRTFRNQACLRNHPPPRQDYFDQLKLCAGALQFEICTDSNKTLAQSLDQANAPHDPQVNRILRSMATQAMSNATYFSSGSIPRDQFAHYGLALDLYTHFTSPIRRYADMVVHRLLLVALELEGNVGNGHLDDAAKDIVHTQLLSNSVLAQQCQQMNDQHRRAQFVQRASVEMFQAMFFRLMPAEDERRLAEAIVYSVRENGLIVLVSKFGVKAALPLKLKDGSVAWVNSDQKVTWLPTSSGCKLQKQKDGVSIQVQNPLCSNGTTQVYRVFDRVLVYISVGESVAHGLQLKADFRGRSVPAPPSEISQSSQPDVNAGAVATLSKQSLVQSVKDAHSGRKRTAANDLDGLDCEELNHKYLKSIHKPNGEYQFFVQLAQKKCQ